MLLIDFPGIFSVQNTINNFKIYNNILNYIPIKMICIVIKYSNRFDHILREISENIKIFKEYKENIVIIINCFEKINLKIKSEIEHIIKKNYKIDNISFYDQQMNPTELSNSFESFKNKMDYIQKISIDIRSLYSTIGEDFNFDFMDERQKYMQEFNDAVKLFCNEFDKTNDKDLKRAIYFSFKNYKETLIERYSEEIKAKKEDTDAIITELIMLNNSIFNSFNNFTKKAEKEITIKFNYNNNPRCNTFRKCPYCGTIWIQIQGCNDIICGEKSVIKDMISGQYKNYLVKYENNQIIISTEIKGNNLIGCGQSLKWDEMEDCTEQVLILLKEIPLSDYDSGIRFIAEKLGESGL